MARLSNSELGMVLGLSLLATTPQTSRCPTIDDGTSVMNANSMYLSLQTSSQIAINNSSNLQNECRYRDGRFKESMYMLGGSIFATLGTLVLFGVSGFFRRDGDYI